MGLVSTLLEILLNRRFVVLASARFARFVSTLLEILQKAK